MYKQDTFYGKRAIHILFVILYSALVILSVSGTVFGIIEANAPLSQGEQLINTLYQSARPRAWWPIVFGIFLTVVCGICMWREVRSLKNFEMNLHKTEQTSATGQAGLIKAIIFIVLAVALVLLGFIFHIIIYSSTLLLVLAIVILAATLCLSNFLEI